MQNWKIKRMSVKRINEWLPAIAELIKHYKGITKICGCVLCDVVVEYSCGNCLWRIIESKHCDDLAYELYRKDASDCRNSPRLIKWRTIRLWQLRRWKKILKAEMARRVK